MEQKKFDENRWDQMIREQEEAHGPLSAEEKAEHIKAWEGAESETLNEKTVDQERKAEGEERQRSLQEEHDAKFDKI